MDSYTAQNSYHNRMGRRIWIPTQHKIIVSTGWEDGFGFLHSTQFLCQQDGKTDLDSYTAQNYCVNRMGIRIWIPNQHKILVTTGWEDGFGFLYSTKFRVNVKDQIEMDLSHRHTILYKETAEGRWE